MIEDPEMIQVLKDFKERNILELIDSHRFNRMIYFFKAGMITGKNSLEKFSKIRKYLANNNEWFVTEDEVMEMRANNYESDDETITKKMEYFMKPYRNS